MQSQTRHDTQPLLILQDISLSYSQIQALKHVHLTLHRSEIHALVGEHESGKSSLGMVASGMLKPGSGLITFDGRPYRWLTRKAAHDLGIEIVHQHILSLSECFTIAENFSLINAPFHHFIRKKKTVRAAASFFSRYGVDFDPLTLVEDLTLSERIFVTILKHLHAKPRLLILDEVLEKLSPTALEKIVRILMTFKQEGMSILFITSKIDDVYNFADRVSIIKKGEILLTDDVKNIGKINLIKMAYMQISEEQQIENLNKEFYQFLKYNEAILRNLPVNLIVTDDAHRIKMVNHSCKQYFGLKNTSYFNVPLSHFFSSSNDDVLTVINQAFSSQEGNTFYQIPMTFNQITAIINIKIFPIYDESFLIGHIIIIEDVTEYNQLQKQVMLSEKLASVGLLAAGVAHEINNPLEIIYNSLTYLKYHVHGEELQDAVDDIQEEMASIANIVSNLHSFSDNKLDNSEDFDVNDLIQNMLNLLKFNARDKQISIHFEPHESDLLIQANKNEIKQVVLNLFKNSFEAMPSGGEIFVHTLAVQENDHHLVQIRFKDTGPGISDENPDNIFLPFYSLKKGHKNNLGLGLSVSYGIIKKYHGAISVENIEPAGGCQFLIQFPQSLPGEPDPTGATDS